MPIRFYNSLLKKGMPASTDPPTTWHLTTLLKRAADSLQEYCAELNGDMNDSIAMEIYAVLDRFPKPGRTKKGYGYDTSGEVQSGSGSGGNQKNIEESNGANPQDGHTSPKNPANSMHDEAAEEFPELNRPSKVRFLPSRGLR